MNLKGKVAIVTGGARDIGKAISKKLAAEGVHVAINYFDNKDQAEQTLSEIEADGGSAILVQGDMTNKAEVDNLVKTATEKFGDKVHCLVNVAGGLVARKTIAEMDEDFINFLFKLNFNSTFLVTQAVVPHMPKGSSIVNFASQAARDGGGPGASAYAASKGAVMTFTRSLAKELGPQGIRVNALCPGMIATKFHDDFTKAQVRANVANATPLKREGDAGEVANLVSFLLSEEGSFLTGNNVDINGGLAFS